jgi:uncharacterized membrane protein
MSNWTFAALTFAAALGSALVAGFFFAFSIVVMNALRRLPPAAGIAAMQSINVVVLNAWFFTAFFGTAAVCIVLAVWSLLSWTGAGSICVLAGSAFYLVGVILVTIARNVPLNDALAAVRPESVEGARLWVKYLSVWTTWNHVRTAAPLAASAAFIIGLRG